jgi:DNA-directed RNA polymerase subunit RPC12/RpoP
MNIRKLVREAIEATVLKCPECSAKIEVDSEQTKAFCKYCGTQIQIKNTTEDNTKEKTRQKMSKSIGENEIEYYQSAAKIFSIVLRIIRALDYKITEMDRSNGVLNFKSFGKSLSLLVLDNGEDGCSVSINGSWGTDDIIIRIFDKINEAL